MKTESRSRCVPRPVFPLLAVVTLLFTGPAPRAVRARTGPSPEATVAGPAAPGTLDTRVQESLLELVRSEDRWLSDYAILLASRYQELQRTTETGSDTRRAGIEELLAACTRRRARETVGLDRLRGDEVPLLVDGGETGPLRQALRRGLDHLAKVPPRTRVPFGGPRSVRSMDLVRTLRLLIRTLDETPSAEDLARRIRERFDVYRSRGSYGTHEVLFTGYGFPVFEGSLEPHGDFRHPVHRLPAGKIAGLSRLSRAEVRAGGLAGRGLEIAWLKDPIDAFLLEVEGSGAVALPDGSYVRVRYAGKNGQAYRSLGKLLIRDGKLKAWEVNIATIRDHFARHPGELEAYLEENPSYVFFHDDRLADRPADPDLTGERTIASDKAFFPRGALAFLDVLLPPDPATPGARATPFRRLVVDMDTGGAIKGPGHIDIYFGNTALGFGIAGGLRHPGRLHYLLARGTRLLGP